MTEGAMADWAAIYLTQDFAASPGVAGASYTVFALFVALGRFQGDALKARFAVDLLARAFAACAILGLGIALLSPNLMGAFIGLSLLGFGVSLGFPLAVSAASVLPGRSAAANVAVLTQMSLCGFLIGPPMIGLLAEVTSVRIGLIALIPWLLLSFVLAGALRPAATPENQPVTGHL
jgi:fucose permease